MQEKRCIAMILAGGQGSRLGTLTKKLAKPAVPFGGKYRIIDFTLSNCCNSGIGTVGVLTQYEPLALHSYIGVGSLWDLNRKDGGVFLLPPYAKAKGGEWYKGTAHAIYQNMDFIESFNPRHVLVLSGDHIYKMDYSLMLKYHEEKGAEATIAVIEVPWEEASRFGIMHTADSGEIIEFEEKPKAPKNNLASMGVYIFNWNLLKQYLKEDARDAKSNHDFGKNVIPRMLEKGQKMFAYPFRGYWKDVGTVESYWEANMDLLVEEPELDLYDPNWWIYGVNQVLPPHYIAPGAGVSRSIICEGCRIYGEVVNSVIFPGVTIGEGTTIKDSVIMADVEIGADVEISRTIVGPRVVVGTGCRVGSIDMENTGEISVIPEGLIIPARPRSVDAQSS